MPLTKSKNTKRPYSQEMLEKKGNRNHKLLRKRYKMILGCLHETRWKSRRDIEKELGFKTTSLQRTFDFMELEELCEKTTKSDPNNEGLEIKQYGMTFYRKKKFIPTSILQLERLNKEGFFD